MSCLFYCPGQSQTGADQLLSKPDPLARGSSILLQECPVTTANCHWVAFCMGGRLIQDFWRRSKQLLRGHKPELLATDIVCVVWYGIEPMEGSEEREEICGLRG